MSGYIVQGMLVTASFITLAVVMRGKIKVFKLMKHVVRVSTERLLSLGCQFGIKRSQPEG